MSSPKRKRNDMFASSVGRSCKRTPTSSYRLVLFSLQAVDPGSRQGAKGSTAAFAHSLVEQRGLADTADLALRGSESGKERKMFCPCRRGHKALIADTKIHSSVASQLWYRLKFHAFDTVVLLRYVHHPSLRPHLEDVTAETI